MDRSTLQLVARYGFALVAVVLTLLLKRLVIDDLLVVEVDSPYLLFFMPVILTAWRAGAGPGLLAVVLNTIACIYDHRPGTPLIEDGASLLMLTIFVGEGLLVCWLMEQLRRARSRAEEAKRVQETFLAKVSHELRVPLNPVMMEAAARLDDPSTPGALRPAFERIRAGVALQARLIDDLLDTVRIGRGKLSFRFEPVDAHEVVALALETCRSEWEARRQRITVDLAARSHLVRADSGRLQQVIWNLVRNAVKFTPEGGTIGIRSRDEAGEDGVRLVLEVSDSGAGIDAQDLGPIFTPFTQGSATVGRFAGLGLGLAICRAIVEAHGGSLLADSPGRGRGATFSLRLATLPRPLLAPTGTEAGTDAPADTDADADAGIKDEAVWGSGGPRGAAARHLLLVEDDEATALVMAELLRQDGYEVTVAPTVAEALLVPIGRIDCVISDLDLPDGTGTDLMRLLHARRPVPAIALTGHQAHASQAGSDDTFAVRLVKPVDYPTLEAAIREVIVPMPC